MSLGDIFIRLGEHAAVFQVTRLTEKRLYLTDVGLDISSTKDMKHENGHPYREITVFCERAKPVLENTKTLDEFWLNKAQRNDDGTYNRASSDYAKVGTAGGPNHVFTLESRIVIGPHASHANWQTDTTKPSNDE
jgi:hypothetical protein